MKAKVKNSGEIVEVEKTVCYCATWSDHQRIYNESDLDFNLDPPHPEATISGWVVVDDFDNAYFYHSKPSRRIKELCDTGDFFTVWYCDTKFPNGKRYYVIDKDLFPNLTPDSDPIEVEITIKPKK